MKNSAANRSAVCIAATSCASAGRRCAASSLLDVLRAPGRGGRRPRAKAKQMIVLLDGRRAAAHRHVRHEARLARRTTAASSSRSRRTCPASQVCELMPELAKLADKYTIIRSVTTMNKPGDHSRAPLYWLTGNPRLPSGTAEYPMYGSVVIEAPARPGRPADVRRARQDRPPHRQRASPRSFLGPALHPVHLRPAEGQGRHHARCSTPQLELPAFDKQRRPAQGRSTASCAGRTRVDPLIAGLDQYQQTAFNLLRSPKLRAGARPVEGDRRSRSSATRGTSRRRPATRPATRCTSCWPAG